MTQDELKQAVADAALSYIRPKLENDTVLGIGTGYWDTGPACGRCGPAPQPLRNGAIRRR